MRCAIPAKLLHSPFCLWRVQKPFGFVSLSSAKLSHCCACSVRRAKRTPYGAALASFAPPSSFGFAKLFLRFRVALASQIRRRKEEGERSNPYGFAKQFKDQRFAPLLRKITKGPTGFQGSVYQQFLSKFIKGEKEIKAILKVNFEDK